MTYVAQFIHCICITVDRSRIQVENDDIIDGWGRRERNQMLIILLCNTLLCS